MSPVAMLAQRWILGVALIVVLSSCIIVLRNLFTRRYYDVDYRPSHLRPKPNPESNHSHLQRTSRNASHPRR